MTVPTDRGTQADKAEKDDEAGPPFWPGQIFGYVSVRGDEHPLTGPLQLDNVERFHGSRQAAKEAKELIESAGLTVVATSKLGFAVVGPKKAWEQFAESELETFERKLFTRKGRLQNVTHIGFKTEDERPVDDLTGRIPAQAENGPIDLLAIERPRPPLNEFPTPIPPTVDRFHLRLPDDVALLLGAMEAHRRGFRGQGVRVAMVDTGWYRHPFFEAQGYHVEKPLTAVAQWDPEFDPNGHGTGESANFFAVAPDAVLQPIRAADDNGHLVATLAAFMKAKERLVNVQTGTDTESGGASAGGGGNAGDSDVIKIITCSWGGDIPYPNVPTIPSAADRVLELEIRDAIDNDIVVIFSAGNGNFGIEAQVPGVIAAGGVFADAGRQLRATPYASGFASKWFYEDDEDDPAEANAVAAEAPAEAGKERRRTPITVPTVCGLVGLPPRASYLMLPVPDGCRIDMERAAAGQGDPADGTSPFDGWALFSGTSAAAPQVAGAAALLRQINPNATPREVAKALCDSATDVRAGRCHPRFDYHAEEGHDLATGWGLVNVSAALRALNPGAWQAADPTPPRLGHAGTLGTATPQQLITLLTPLAAANPNVGDLERALTAAGLQTAIPTRAGGKLWPKEVYQALLDELRRGDPFGFVTLDRVVSFMHS